MTTKTWTDEDVALHYATIRTAIDPDSPFCGMIDLRGLFDLPLDLQRAIHARMTPEERDRMAKLYGPGAKRESG